MPRFVTTMALALALFGCATAGMVDYARLPAGFYPADPDDAALQETYRMFGAGGEVPASPQARARGFAALEYVTGALQVSGRWDGIGGLAGAQLMIARRDGRQALGIQPTAKSQAIVDALLAVSQTSNDAALMAALANPVFSLGAPASLERLRNLPDLTEIGYALRTVAQGLNAQQYPQDIN